MKASTVLLVLSPLFLSAQAFGQEEVGERKRAKILIEWAKTETKSYAIRYEKVIPLTTVKKVGDALEDALAQYVKVFLTKPPEKLQVKFLDSQNTYEQE